MSSAVTLAPVRSHVQLRSFEPSDLPALVELWNKAFTRRHNFRPLTAEAYRARVLNSPVFDARGLILAWIAPLASRPDHDSTHLLPDRQKSELVGFVHAFKPSPNEGQFAKWPPQHQIALLYVKPNVRRQGIGSKLLQAAESWLYYCPVYIAGDSMPCYGTIEGPVPPFFGSTERLGIDAAGSQEEQALIGFLSRHGYRADDAGDVSMTLALSRQHSLSVTDLDAKGLRVLSIDHEHPFRGSEPYGREEYRLWGDNNGYPYRAFVLVDQDDHLRGHISWYPISNRQDSEQKVALSHFWLASPLRGQGLGRFLLDLGLHAMSESAPIAIELHTHLLHHDRAVSLYESRGFQIDKAWVKLVKT